MQKKKKLIVNDNLFWILHYSVNWWYVTFSHTITPLPINISPPDFYPICFIKNCQGWGEEATKKKKKKTWWKEIYFYLNFMPGNMKSWKHTEKDRHFLNRTLRARPNACCQIKWRLVWSKNRTLFWDWAN